MKQFKINLIKYAKDPYAENYKTVLREIKELSKQRDILCSWIKRLNVVSAPQINVYIQCNANQNRLFWGRNWYIDSKIQLEMQRT